MSSTKGNSMACSVYRLMLSGDIVLREAHDFVVVTNATACARLHLSVITSVCTLGFTYNDYVIFNSLCVSELQVCCSEYSSNPL